MLYYSMSLLSENAVRLGIKPQPGAKIEGERFPVKPIEKG